MKVTTFDPTLPAKNLIDTFDQFFNRNIAEFFGSDDIINTPSVNVERLPTRGGCSGIDKRRYRA
jgi:hypothetical protein